jgi:hypothetical protein
MYMLPVFTAVYPLFLSQSNENSSIPSSVSNGFVVGGTAIYTLFVFWANGQNMLGWETTGLANLLLTPLPRQRVFLGKALAQFLMNMPPILVLITIAIIRQPDLVSFSLLTTTIGLGLACTAVVSNFSALFPYPVNIEKQSGQNPFAGGGGCLTGLANGTLMPLMIAIFCLPGALPLVIALFTGLDWLALVGAVLTPVYGAVIFWFGTKLAGRLLLQREPEVLIATRPKEDRG